MVTDDYVPVALRNKPELDNSTFRLLTQYLMCAEMVPEGFNGRGPITLLQIDLYMKYYPVDDVYYFIDLMREIDRRVRNNTRSKDQREAGGSLRQVS